MKTRKDGSRVRRARRRAGSGVGVALLLGAAALLALIFVPYGASGRSDTWRITRLLGPHEWGFGVNPNGRVIVRAPARPGDAIRLRYTMPDKRRDEIWLSRHDGCVLVAEDGVVSPPRPHLPQPPASVTARWTADLGNQSPLSYGWDQNGFFWPVRGRTVRIGFIEVGSCPGVSVRREDTRAESAGKQVERPVKPEKEPR